MPLPGGMSNLRWAPDDSTGYVTPSGLAATLPVMRAYGRADFKPREAGVYKQCVNLQHGTYAFLDSDEPVDNVAIAGEVGGYVRCMAITSGPLNHFLGSGWLETDDNVGEITAIAEDLLTAGKNYNFGKNQ